MQVKNYIIPELFTIKNLEYRIVTFLPAQSLQGLVSTLRKVTLLQEKKCIHTVTECFREGISHNKKRIAINYLLTNSILILIGASLYFQFYTIKIWKKTTLDNNFVKLDDMNRTKKAKEH